MTPPVLDERSATFSPRVRLGPYELLMELARGGVATAIVARKGGAAGFERLVVIKRVHRSLLGNSEFSKMIRDEARLASSIHHPNVASVIDVVESGAELCLVMEYFEALSFSALLAAAGADRRPTPRIVSRILSDALGGLHAAHEATDVRHEKLGIVHRDFTPQNLICDTEGVTRVIDFGIAKATSRLTKTKSGIVKGKVAYMAPEQIEALPVDRRTDVFAAGVMLHEALTGHSLFGAKDDFATMRQILAGRIPRLAPPELDAVLQLALARAPGDRFPTALAFQAALEKALPPASAREASVWVQSVGGGILAGRRKELLDMLREDVAADARILESGRPSPALEFVDPTGVTANALAPLPGDASSRGDDDLVPAGLPTRGNTALRVGAAMCLLAVLGVAAAVCGSHGAAVP
ncbi:MAG: serine/threonine protein kinase [Polyangiaceae bacterium]